MKILFVADLHVKLGQKNVPKDFQVNRFNLLADRLNSIGDFDNLVIGGDFFDKLPKLEEIVLARDFLAELKHDVILYDGNHEATKKGATFLPMMQSLFPFNVTVVDEFTSGFLPNSDILPYNCLRDENIEGKNPILFTHVRGDIPPHVKAEVDLDMFNDWDLVVAGDLHSHENSQRNIVYPGSPMHISFHRNKTKGTNGALVVDLAEISWEFVDLEMPQLIRLTVDTPEKIVKTDYDHTIYELAGEHRMTKKSDLLTMKLPPKDYSATLDLENKSMVEELSLYLTKVKNKKPEKYVETFLDIIKETDLG